MRHIVLFCEGLQDNSAPAPAGRLGIRELAEVRELLLSGPLDQQPRGLRDAALEQEPDARGAVRPLQPAAVLALVQFPLQQHLPPPAVHRVPVGVARPLPRLLGQLLLPLKKKLLEGTLKDAVVELGAFERARRRRRTPLRAVGARSEDLVPFRLWEGEEVPVVDSSVLLQVPKREEERA